MADYWVSHKRYHCKYCNIYIADDKPSRLQHENGLRHKGNVERFVRGLYKEGEKRVRDSEEEKAIMAQVEQTAGAAYARDLASGHRPAASSSSSSPLPTAPKQSKPTRQNDRYAHYTTPAQLGYTDPDEEAAERRRGMGIVGEWSVVVPPPAASADNVEADGEVKPDVAEGKKRQLTPEDEDDIRTFKLRKKTVDIHDDDDDDGDLMPIKLKSRKEKETSDMMMPASTAIETAQSPRAHIKKEEDPAASPAITAPPSFFRKRKLPAHRREG